MLLKAYAFLGIFGTYGAANSFLDAMGIGGRQILFTDFSFIFVSVYIFLPFMILPIFNSLDELNPTLLDASNDLGGSSWVTFKRVIFPLTLDGVKAGCQIVFIPALSLFMLTRLIAGNRVITLGTAIEQHFLVTQDWGMGSTIAVFLIIAMVFIMVLTGRRKRGFYNENEQEMACDLFGSYLYHPVRPDLLLDILFIQHRRDHVSIRRFHLGLVSGAVC